MKPVSKYAKSLLKMNFETISVYVTIRNNINHLEPFSDKKLAELGNWRELRRGQQWVLSTRVSHDIVTDSIIKYMAEKHVDSKDYDISYTNSWPYGDKKAH